MNFIDRAKLAARALFGGTPLSTGNIVYMGGDSYSGVTVTEDRAMTFAPVFACVRIISEDIGALPVHLYKRTDSGREIARDHPVDRLMREPNPMMTASVFRETMMGHVLLWGNFYAEIEFNADMEPVALWPLNPANTKPMKTKDGDLYYQTYLPDGKLKELYDYQVWHLMGYSTDGMSGRSAISMMRETVGLGMAAQEFGGRYFGSGANMGGFFETPGTLSEPAYNRLKTEINEQMSGLSKAHRAVILEEGAKFARNTIPANEAQMLETRKFQIEDVARFFRVPLHLVGDLSRCMPADTLVYTAHGPKWIADIKAGEMVWSPTANGLMLKKVLTLWENGMDEILEIKTTNRTVKCNAKHRLMVWRAVERPLADGEVGGRNVDGEKVRLVWEKQYVSAGDLAIGDTLVALDELPEQSGQTAPNGRMLTKGFMEFCGLLLGDGNVLKQRNKPTHVGISRGSSAGYMDHYRNVIKSEFERYDGGNGRGDLSAIPRAEVTLVEEKRQTRFASVLAANELTELGLSGTAFTKRVPGWVFTTAKEFRLAFLRGFLDADGTVDKKGRITYYSANKALIDDLRHLCMGVGVPVTNTRSDVNRKPAPGSKALVFTRMWRFTCSDAGANRLIGSHDPRYIKRFADGKPFGKKGRAYPRFGGNDFNESGLSLSKICAIKTLPAEPVYDIEVEESHCFIADGVVSHNSTNNNIEHQSIDYLVHCLLPWLVKIEQVNDRKLLIGATERAQYFSKHNMDGLLRGDTQTRYAAYAVGRQWGWLSANDVREKEDMNKIEGGDIYLVPMNMIPADRIGDPPDDEDFEQGATRRAEVRSAAEYRASPTADAIRYAQARLDVIHAAEVAIKDALEGIISAHCDTLSGYVPLIEQGAPDKFITSAADYLLDRTQYERFASALGASVPDFAVQTRQILQAELGNVLNDIEYKKIIDGFISSAAKDYPARSLEQLRQILSSKKSVDEIAEKIRGRLLDWHNNRALQLGENSAVKLTNEMTRKAAKKKGYRVIWQVMSGSPCQFCATLNGVTVDAGDTFHSTKKGHKNRLNPPLHNGCHCMLVVESK